MENHNLLLCFLTDVAKKYHDSHWCDRRNKGAKLKTPVIDERIKVKTQMNASLFCNAILYYLFSEAGLTTAMQDKHKRVYPSNVLSSLYRRAWTHACSNKKLTSFILIKKEACSLLDQSDSEFAVFVDHVVIPLYIGVCKEQSMPAYDEETDEYEQSTKNSILEWACRYWNALLLPKSSQETAYAVKKEQEALILKLRDQELPTTSEATKTEESDKTTQVTVTSEESQTPKTGLNPVRFGASGNINATLASYIKTRDKLIAEIQLKQRQLADLELDIILCKLSNS